jgi:hypothetical protein
MRIVAEIEVLNADDAKDRLPIAAGLADIRAAVSSIVWPSGSNRFTIHPESGKKSGQGNGVRPIRDAFVLAMAELGWQPEAPYPLASVAGVGQPGGTDVAKVVETGSFLVEWETGNISSSHRSMNKMALALQHGAAAAGVLIVPSVRLARYLTDRVGNERELRPYLRFWSSVVIEDGYLGIFVVEHDDESLDVPRIKKGTDGRALR